MGEAARSGARKPSKRLTWFGIGITVIYLGSVAAIALAHLSVMASLTPNEWGDYLAGVFGPLAFLWLVLGYFQQGDELRYSAEALWLQGEELRNSVEQQRQLVQVTRDQIDLERKNASLQREDHIKRSQPIFIISYKGRSQFDNYSLHLIDVENIGQDCSDFRLFARDKLVTRTPILARGTSTSGNATLASDMKFDGTEIRITFTDLDGWGGSRSFRYDNGQFIALELLLTDGHR